MNRIYIYLLLLSLGLFATEKLSAQHSLNDTSLNIPMFYISYSFQAPGGDMADRFGINSTIGGGFQYKTWQNWLFGLDVSFIFGSEVKNADSLMYNLRTESGYIIDMSGGFGNYSLYERGYTISGSFGKLFPVLSPNPNSGLYITGGIGYIQHKIRIEVIDNAIPQLNGDYKKGYDRLTGGFMIKQFIGYKFLSDNRLLNFFGGIEFTQSWTKPLRDVNFDSMLPDSKSNRFDTLIGFRIGWIVPIYERKPEKFYYY